MEMKKKFTFVLIILFSACCLLCSVACADVPRLINYQGKLTGIEGTPMEGVYNITFRIYTAASGGTLLWEETQSVIIQKGIFHVLLGGVSSLDLPFDNPYWLAVKVGTDSEMTPRQQIASAGYAIHADIASTLSDPTKLVPSGAIIMWSGSLNSIPDGWALCNGANGTPDLRNRFIIGAGSSYSPGQSGGSATHTHSASCSGGSDRIWIDDNSGGTDYWANRDTHSHTITVNASNHLPPYYALAYIMKL